MKEIIYRLVAEVDGEVVFRGEYPDTAILQEELYKPESAVQRVLDEDLEDE